MPTYSDASSSYWPPGWNFARFSQATKDDIATLPPGELEKMQAGLRDVLGEHGVGALAQYLFQEEQRRQPRAPSPFRPPNWLQHWRKYTRRSGEKTPWGFVIFRTAAYDSDDVQWDECKTEIERIAALPFERGPDDPPVPEDYHDAKAGFEIRWVEDPKLAGANADVLREKYARMRPDLPSGLAQEIFLCVSPKVVTSVLSVSEEARPRLGAKTWRFGAPFLLAVAADSDSGLEEDHEKREWFKPVFKVATETVADELWWLLDSGMTSLRKITRLVQGSDELGGRSENAEGLDDMWWTTAPSPERLRKWRRWVPGHPHDVERQTED